MFALLYQNCFHDTVDVIATSEHYYDLVREALSLYIEHYTISYFADEGALIKYVSDYNNGKKSQVV